MKHISPALVIFQMESLVIIMLRFYWLRLEQHGCHFADNIFKQIFLNENCCILIEISLKFVPEARVSESREHCERRSENEM